MNVNFMKIATKKLTQSGFSLIELMIAMALGSFIIGGLISVFIGSTNSYKLQQAISQIQDKGRYAIKKIREDVQRSGFGLDYDTIAVRQIMGGVNTCVADVNTPILEVYWHKKSPDTDMRRCYFLNASNQLILREITGAANTVPVAADTEFVVVNDVHLLAFSFAVDLDDIEGIDIVPTKSAYLPRDEMIVGNGVTPATTATWKKVRAVRMHLIVASDTDFVTDQAQTIAPPFGTTLTTFFAQDRRLYHRFSATLALRNLKH